MCTNKYKQAITKIKAGWKATPTWVKVLDVLCWISMAITTLYVYR